MRGANWQAEREQRVSDRRSLQRAARDAWGEWLDREIAPTVFGTLTFRPRQDSRPLSHAAAERAFGRFLDHASGLLGCEVRGVVTVEDHRSGAPHGHALLSLSRAHRTGDRAQLRRAWKRSHRRAGNVLDFQKPRSRRDAGRYVAKYVVKRDGGLVFSEGFGKR